MNQNEFISDIFHQVEKRTKALGLEQSLNNVKDMVFICPDYSLVHMMIGAMQFYQSKNNGPTVHMLEYMPSQAQRELPAYIDRDRLQVWSSAEEMLSSWPDDNSKTVVFYFANLLEGDALSQEARTARKKHLETCLRCFTDRPNTFLVFVPLMPVLDTLPSGCNGMAEREIEVLWRDKPENSPEKFILELEECCRRRMYENAGSNLSDNGTISIKVARLDSVFGPGIQEKDGGCFRSTVDELLNNLTLTMCHNDHRCFYSALYVQDAILTLLLLGIKGRRGNIYHVSSFDYSLMEVKTAFLSAASDLDVKLQFQEEEEVRTEYHVLNASKSRLMHSPKKEEILHSTLKEAVTYTFQYWYNNGPYLPQDPLNVYYGRIDRIRQMELEVLKEVDKICKENHIQYFLAGGSMLGAIRHKGFIPWDDDVDIAMLPGEYKKFLKVCPQSLQTEYSYQNFDTDLESHYIHDKIRISDTYFSTAYSNQYRMANGVYIDVFVYYKTSNHPLMQKVHLRLIKMWRAVIGIRWADRPRRGHHYKLSKIMLPFMRLVPFRWYHIFYTKLLELYEKRNTKYRIDSGLNLMKCGAFPAEWFDEATEAEFCGQKYPIPAKYDAYLKHWYGDKYMDLLPISQRNSVHDVVRIDLGRKLFPETEKMTFHKADLRGELYEKPLDGEGEDHE